jgi:hypothetical protein
MEKVMHIFPYGIQSLFTALASAVVKRRGSPHGTNFFQSNGSRAATCGEARQVRWSH